MLFTFIFTTFTIVAAVTSIFAVGEEANVTGALPPRPIHVEGFVYAHDIGIMSLEGSQSGARSVVDDYSFFKLNQTFQLLAGEVGRSLRFNRELPFYRMDIYHPFDDALVYPVMALLDSGASLNVLPKSFAAALKLQAAGTCELEFSGFGLQRGVMSVVAVHWNEQKHNVTVCIVSSGSVTIMNLDVLKLWGLCLCDDGTVSAQCFHPS